MPRREALALSCRWKLAMRDKAVKLLKERDPP